MRVRTIQHSTCHPYKLPMSKTNGEDDDLEDIIEKFEKEKKND